jgi:hypothetical protein
MPGPTGAHCPREIFVCGCFWSPTFGGKSQEPLLDLICFARQTECSGDVGSPFGGNYAIRVVCDCCTLDVGHRDRSCQRLSSWEPSCLQLQRRCPFQLPLRTLTITKPFWTNSRVSERGPGCLWSRNAPTFRQVSACVDFTICPLSFGSTGCLSSCRPSHIALLHFEDIANALDEPGLGEALASDVKSKPISTR